MTRIIPSFAALVAVLAAASPAAAKTAPVPEHPKQLEYGKLKFEVPDEKPYRHELENGMLAFVVEDHALPLVTVSINFKGGTYLEPEGMTGLAALTGTMLRKGGTTSLSADEFDEKAAFLAANLGASIDDTSGTASANCLNSVLDECLEMLFDMLKNPRFQPDRLDVEKTTILEGMKQRNDHAQSILSREWTWLLYGWEHFSTRHLTKSSLDAVTREEMQKFHARIVRPENMLVAVAGAVKTDEILKKLEAHFADWPGEKQDSVPWPPPKPSFDPTPGVYHVEKDIPQGRVAIGHLALQITDWNNPDLQPIKVMNDILGGGGFTSRITKRIRSDEGLAYSAGSYFTFGIHWAGTFGVGFQSKNPTVAYASKIALEEIERIRKEPVTEEELRTSKNSFIETFPQQFDSAESIASLLVSNEMVGRPHSYWKKYRERIAAVDADDVLRVAQEVLHPDRLLFLIVGRWEEIEKGDADGKGSMKEFYDGQVEHLPLRDPLTLEPME